MWYFYLAFILPWDFIFVITIIHVLDILQLSTEEIEPSHETHTHWMFVDFLPVTSKLSSLRREHKICNISEVRKSKDAEITILKNSVDAESKKFSSETIPLMCYLRIFRHKIFMIYVKDADSRFTGKTQRMLYIFLSFFFRLHVFAIPASFLQKGIVIRNWGERGLASFSLTKYSSEQDILCGCGAFTSWQLNSLTLCRPI